MDLITLALAKQYTNQVAGSGVKGDPGKSAYEIAVENGFQGTEQEWLASLVGQEGPIGPHSLPRRSSDHCRATQRRSSSP